MITPISQQKPWLPYLVAGIGIVISFLLWHFILWHHIEAYLDALLPYKSYLSWLMLLLGVSFSILAGAIIRIIQLDYERTALLNQMQTMLKKEIAERMLAEESKQKLEVALLQGQKLQAIGTLAGGIAHDFNNILYAIIGYTEMLREDEDVNSLKYNNLGRVLEATQRGRELIARILAFSRKQHHEFDMIDLNHTIETALSLLKPTIPASVMVQFESSKDISIVGNQTQIHQVLVNIINNAVDAMEGEGTITIHTTHLPPDDPLLKQLTKTSIQKYCKLEISDTGHGMDQATMERAFEPFFTTKEVGKGSGLGLSIVHSIIKEHKGEILLNSQLGHGTTFTILLPECLS
ncbi:MAG: hypothetical protein A3F42_00260 [Gammaproteobacteria bacterium RIFCSPHIGHO2_12_FULL_37_34]|nr:MAG: hypothetical protein A3F42_00260 [Gammaproteobacteria bacterium RIFCSPHIGHO2_12_FULL_37_34]